MKLYILILLISLLHTSCKTSSTLNPMACTLNNKVVYWIEVENMMVGVYETQGESFCISPTLFMDCSRGDTDCHYMVSPNDIIYSSQQSLLEYAQMYKCLTLKIVKYKGLKYIETIETIKKTANCDNSVNKTPRT